MGSRDTEKVRGTNESKAEEGEVKHYRIIWLNWTHGPLQDVSHMLIPLPIPYCGGILEGDEILDTTKCVYFSKVHPVIDINSPFKK